jgi:hypothetical protein
MDPLLVPAGKEVTTPLIMGACEGESCSVHRVTFSTIGWGGRSLKL